MKKDKEMTSEIGARLAKLRRSAGYSMQDVANAINVKVSTYREWEYGRKISGEPYIELAKLYKISLYEILTGQKNDCSKIIDDISELLDELKKKLN